jgi:ABC-type bacteriocin/lantibiotic exporter with double-glycine peptidase domain
MGELTLGQLVAAELIVGIIVAGFVKFNKSLESFYDMQAAIDKLGHLIDLPVEDQPASDIRVAGKPGSIDWHGVSFAYQGSRELLANSALSIPAGACVAVFGRGGEGKSTVVDLLAGLRMPGSGVMQLNGLDYREYGLSGVRSHIALVRDVEVFPGTLLENVRLGSDTTPSDVTEALVRVGLEEALLSLPEGVRTELAPGGQPLSRSQALRLMLARAIVRRPDVLVLDEVLDHLDDFDPNGALAHTLFAPNRPWTLVIATEDRSIAAHCDRVISVSGGRLLERLPSEMTQFVLQGGAR